MAADLREATKVVAFPGATDDQLDFLDEIRGDVSNGDFQTVVVLGLKRDGEVVRGVCGSQSNIEVMGLLAHSLIARALERWDLIETAASDDEGGS